MSPLVRTLQTAAGIFGYHGESAKGPTSNGKELMHPVTAAKLERTEHPAVQAPKDLPMIITSKCRERMGELLFKLFLPGSHAVCCKMWLIGPFKRGRT